MTTDAGTASVLIVSGSAQGIKFISDLLDPAFFSPVRYVKSGSEARRALGSENIDILIVNAPLPDEFGDELAADAVEVNGIGTLLLVKSELYAEKSDTFARHGVLVLPKPLTRQILTQAFRLMLTSQLRVKTIVKENKLLRAKLEENKVISRAKCLLIEKLAMHEPEAHRYIEKVARDTRKTRYEVAVSILKEYAEENL